MPIAIALLLLWVGTLLDMASTYLMVVVIGDEFREINQNYIDANGDFSVSSLVKINSVFLLAFSMATMLPLRNRNVVKKYLRERALGAHLEDKWAANRRVISSVWTLVVIGAVGGMRFLFFVNNLTEYFGSPGFIRAFLWVFPAVHEQLTLHIVSAIAVVAFYPMVYLLLRLSVR
ncbi:hypothetical protein [Candidatus Foliamicus sp.]